jgi:hypothetical protein
MQIGGALVKAITRLLAPAAVAGGQAGAIGVWETGAVVGGTFGNVLPEGTDDDVDELVDELDEVDEVLDVVVLEAAGFDGLLPASRNTMSTMAATTSVSAPLRRAIRLLRLALCRCSVFC